MVVSLAMGGMLFDIAVWPLGGLILWNMTMTMFAGLNLRLAYHRQISLAIDLFDDRGIFLVAGGHVRASVVGRIAAYFDRGNLL
jgi:hypothetical protein